MAASPHSNHPFERATAFMFALAAGFLMLLSLILFGYAVVSTVRPLIALSPNPKSVITGVQTAVIAIAVFDVAKFLIDEEVIRGRELRHTAEARRSLTKFMAIIIIAISLETLVKIFEVESSKMSDLLYPAILFASVGFALLALGGLQRLAHPVEERQQEKGEEPRDGHA